MGHKKHLACDLEGVNKQQPYYFYTQTVGAPCTHSSGSVGSSCRHGTTAEHLQLPPLVLQLLLLGKCMSSSIMKSASSSCRLLASLKLETWSL